MTAHHFRYPINLQDELAQVFSLSWALLYLARVTESATSSWGLQHSSSISPSSLLGWRWRCSATTHRRKYPNPWKPPSPIAISNLVPLFMPSVRPATAPTSLWTQWEMCWDTPLAARIAHAQKMGLATPFLFAIRILATFPSKHLFIIIFTTMWLVYLLEKIWNCSWTRLVTISNKTYLTIHPLWVKVSDLGWTNNPNTTPIKGLRKEQVVVCLRGTRGEIAYGEGDASTPKGWCRRRQRALLMTRSDGWRRELKTRAFL